MFFKKKKDERSMEDYYKNELMRSRMSEVSLRTDEIIQQYFFVSRDKFLTLEEYLKIREIAKQELGLLKPEPSAGEILGSLEKFNNFKREEQAKTAHYDENGRNSAKHQAENIPIDENVRDAEWEKVEEPKHKRAAKPIQETVQEIPVMRATEPEHKQSEVPRIVEPEKPVSRKVEPVAEPAPDSDDATEAAFLAMIQGIQD